MSKRDNLSQIFRIDMRKIHRGVIYSCLGTIVK